MFFKLRLRHMSPRVQRDDLSRVEPRGIGSDREWRVGVGVIGDVSGVEGVQRHSQGAVDGVRARVRADCVTMGDGGGFVRDY
jgi:hypothetical protein